MNLRLVRATSNDCERKITLEDHADDKEDYDDNVGMVETERVEHDNPMTSSQYWTMKGNTTLWKSLIDSTNSEIEFITDKEAIIYIGSEQFHLKLIETDHTVTIMISFLI